MGGGDSKGADVVLGELVDAQKARHAAARGRGQARKGAQVADEQLSGLQLKWRLGKDDCLIVESGESHIERHRIQADQSDFRRVALVVDEEVGGEQLLNDHVRLGGEGFDCLRSGVELEPLQCRRG